MALKGGGSVLANRETMQRGNRVVLLYSAFSRPAMRVLQRVQESPELSSFIVPASADDPSVRAFLQGKGITSVPSLVLRHGLEPATVLSGYEVPMWMDRFMVNLEEAQGVSARPVSPDPQGPGRPPAPQHPPGPQQRFPEQPPVEDDPSGMGLPRKSARAQKSTEITSLAAQIEEERKELERGSRRPGPPGADFSAADLQTT